MGWLDKVPDAGNLYIGGILDGYNRLYALSHKEEVKEANITHVLSVINLPLDPEIFESFKHLRIDLEDVDDEDLLQHFPKTNQFIQEGLDGGGGVFVHCAMGKSRSAAVVIAYLMSKYNLTPETALKQLQQGRGVCDPNDGFKEQLRLYYDMGTSEDVENQPIYQRWLYQKALSASRACGIAPGADEIRFEDEHVREDGGKVDFELKCKKCRRTLASSAYLVKHVPRELKGMVKDESIPDSPSTCQHYFLEALSWMKPELEQGKIDGRLECPKCRTNVGRYAWQGIQCSCGDWVVPGISLAKGRVDAAVARRITGKEEGALEMPPGGGAVRGVYKGNL